MVEGPVVALSIIAVPGGPRVPERHRKIKKGAALSRRITGSVGQCCGERSIRFITLFLEVERTGCKPFAMLLACDLHYGKALLVLSPGIISALSQGGDLFLIVFTIVTHVTTAGWRPEAAYSV